MTLLNLLKVLETTYKVVIMNDDSGLYERFKSSADAYVWLAEHKEYMFTNVASVIPLLLQDGKLVTVITIEW